MQIMKLFSGRSKVLLVLITLGLAACRSAADRPAPDSQGGKKLDPDAPASGRLGDLLEQRRQANPLDLPPDIINDTDPQLVETLDAQRQEYIARQEVLPEVVNARIVEVDNGRGYVEIDAPADLVWTRILEYWAEENVVMSKLEPKQGLMETEWIENLDELEETTGPMRFFKETFNRITGRGIEHDKYRLQLARDGEKTRVFVDHRATVREAAESGSKKIADFEWVQKTDNPLKVREMMQVVVLLFERV